MTYWIYENWTRSRARLHTAACGSCQNGTGTQPADSGKNGHWRGPYTDRVQAQRILETLPVRDRQVCAQCMADL